MISAASASLRCTPLALLALTLASSGSALGATVNAGDIIVSDWRNATLWAVDPGTGEQRVITADGLLSRPDGLAVDADGNLWVADLDANAIVHVDIATGDQTLVADDFIADFSGYERMPLVLGPDDDLYVARLGAITRVDPATGSKSLLYDQSFVLAWARGIAFDASGRLWATGTDNASALTSVIRFDSSSDPIPDILCHYTISSVDPCPVVSDPRDLMLDLDTGDVVSAFDSSGGISRLDPVTGSLTPISSLGADGLALAFGGYYATSSSGDGELYHVDRTTGAVTLVSGLDQVGTQPWDIEVALVTVVPEPDPVLGLFAGGAGVFAISRLRLTGRRADVSPDRAL